MQRRQFIKDMMALSALPFLPLSAIATDAQVHVPFKELPKLHPVQESVGWTSAQLHKAALIAKEKHDYEHELVETYSALREARLKRIGVKDELHHPDIRVPVRRKKVRIGNLSTEEETFLHDGKYFGNYLRKCTPTSWYHDPFWKNGGPDKYQLNPMDCTINVYEGLHEAFGESDIYSDYMNKVYGIDVFPVVSSAKLHAAGLESIFIAENTTAERRNYLRYRDGSRYGGLTVEILDSMAKLFLDPDAMRRKIDMALAGDVDSEEFEKLKRTMHYTLTDYVVTGEDVLTPEFKQFMERTPGIFQFHNHYHMAIKPAGTTNMIEADMTGNPLFKNVFWENDVHAGLLYEGERNWRNATFWVERGSAKNFVRYLREQENAPITPLDIRTKDFSVWGEQ